MTHRHLSSPTEPPLPPPTPPTHAPQGEARLLRDEVHRVALELQARQLALQKLRRKHETLVLKGRCQDGEGGGWQGPWAACVCVQSLSTILDFPASSLPANVWWLLPLLLAQARRRTARRTSSSRRPRSGRSWQSRRGAAGHLSGTVAVPAAACGRATCPAPPCLPRHGHAVCSTKASVLPPPLQAEALKAQIAQAERECGALEATLRRLVGTNSDMHYHARWVTGWGFAVQALLYVCFQWLL